MFRIVDFHHSRAPLAVPHRATTETGRFGLPGHRGLQMLKRRAAQVHYGAPLAMQHSIAILIERESMDSERYATGDRDPLALRMRLKPHDSCRLIVESLSSSLSGNALTFETSGRCRNEPVCRRY